MYELKTIARGCIEVEEKAKEYRELELEQLAIRPQTAETREKIRHYSKQKALLRQKKYAYKQTAALFGYNTQDVDDAINHLREKANK